VTCEVEQMINQTARGANKNEKFKENTNIKYLLAFTLKEQALKTNLIIRGTKMNKIISSITSTGVLLALCFGLSFNAMAKNNGGGKHYVFNLIGTGAMYEAEVADIDGDGVDDPAICFDVDLINAKNQQLIGTATDCLSDVTPTETVIGTALELVGTTTFHLPQGDLVVRGNTTVQPVLHPIMTPSGQNITHITGASGTEDAVINGTGRFAGAAATARLSGMVDLSGFGGNVGEPITFDCLFVVDLY